MHQLLIIIVFGNRTGKSRDLWQRLELLVLSIDNSIFYGIIRFLEGYLRHKNKEIPMIG